jgi:hypothetical protein
VFDTLVEIGLGGGHIDPRLVAGLTRSLVAHPRPRPARTPTRGSRPRAAPCPRTPTPRPRSPRPSPP